MPTGNFRFGNNRNFKAKEKVQKRKVNRYSQKELDKNDLMDL